MYHRTCGIASHKHTTSLIAIGPIQLIFKVPILKRRIDDKDSEVRGGRWEVSNGYTVSIGYKM